MQCTFKAGLLCSKCAGNVAATTCRQSRLGDDVAKRMRRSRYHVFGQEAFFGVQFEESAERFQDLKFNMNESWILPKYYMN